MSMARIQQSQVRMIDYRINSTFSFFCKPDTVCSVHFINIDVYRNPIYDRQEWWNRHISRWRYVRYLVDFPTKSRLLKRTFPAMSVLVLWSCIAVALSSHDISVAKLHIGLTPMSLVSTFVAGLLTLRGNQGLSRLQEARKVIGEVKRRLDRDCNYTRFLYG